MDALARRGRILRLDTCISASSAHVIGVRKSFLSTFKSTRASMSLAWRVTSMVYVDSMRIYLSKWFFLLFSQNSRDFQLTLILQRLNTSLSYQVELSRSKGWSSVWIVGFLVSAPAGVLGKRLTWVSNLYNYNGQVYHLIYEDLGSCCSILVGCHSLRIPLFL